MARGIRKVGENILAPKRAIIVTDKNKSQYKWNEIPDGSLFIDTVTGIMSIKLEGESDWVPFGIKNDGTICIAKDTKLVTEVYTIKDPDEGDGHFSCTNTDGDIRHYTLTKDGYIFELEKGSYQMGRNQMTIIIDDCLHRSEESGGISELSETKVLLKDKLVAGQEVTIMYSNVVRIGNPYPRIFINNNEPDVAEVGDLWVDTDASLTDEDLKGNLEDPNYSIPWSMISGKPNSIAGYGIIDEVSYTGHVHKYGDILGSPVAMKADGGNSDTVDYYHADNNKAGTLAIIEKSTGKLPQSIIPTTFTKGMIMMWYGASNNVPNGWAICDGKNGTPNLTDRFVVGAGASYGLGSIGGVNTVTLNTNQMPSHTHVISGNGSGDVIGSFRTWKCDPQATGCFSQTSAGTICNSRDGGGDGGWRIDLKASNLATNMKVANSGGNQAHENRPPYYALFYIMKL